MKKLSVIIINYNTPELTARAVRHFFKSEPYLDFEVIIVDNGSKDKMALASIADRRITYIENGKNLGFAGGVNLGIEKATGEFIFLLNSDAFIMPGAVSRALDSISEYNEKSPLPPFQKGGSKAGIVGLSLVSKKGQIQPSFGFFPNFTREVMRFFMLSKILPGGTLVFFNRFTNKNFFTHPVEVDWVSGGAMLFKRAVLDNIGKLDSGFFFGIEDWDFCKRAKGAGFKIFYLPASQALHLHGGSSGGKRSTWSLRREAEGFDLFMRKHYPKRFFLRTSVGILYYLKAYMLDMGLIQNAKVKMQNDK
jgi:N-acetylglucosaminyl-diphospho-decaprenol L-rhamnosyltransferase